MSAWGQFPQYVLSKILLLSVKVKELVSYHRFTHSEIEWESREEYRICTVRPLWIVSIGRDKTTPMSMLQFISAAVEPRNRNVNFEIFLKHAFSEMQIFFLLQEKQMVRSKSRLRCANEQRLSTLTENMNNKLIHNSNLTSIAEYKTDKCKFKSSDSGLLFFLFCLFHQADKT